MLVPACAEQQIVCLDQDRLIVYPRQSVSYLDRRLQEIKAAGLLTIAIGLFNHKPLHLYNYRDWLELRLGCEFEMVRCRSVEYRNMQDCALYHSDGPRVYKLSKNGVVQVASQKLLTTNLQL